jgi:hypothetical protein
MAHRDPLTAPDETEFCRWLGQASVGDAVEYHRGFLAVDLSLAGSPLSPSARKKLASLASRAWWAAERGLVDLAQRRRGPEDYVYVAILRRRPTPLQRQRAAFPALMRSLPWR